MLLRRDNVFVTQEVEHRHWASQAEVRRVGAQTVRPPEVRGGMEGQHLEQHGERARTRRGCSYVSLLILLISTGYSQNWYRTAKTWKQL